MKKLLWAIVLMAGWATACQRNDAADDDLACPVPGPATFEALTKRHSPPVQVFTFDPTTDHVFQSAGGAYIRVSPNVFVRPDGTPPTGPIELRFQEIYSPGNMILANMPTMAGLMMPLESGGEFNIRVMDGTTRLKLTPWGRRGGFQMNSPVPARVSPGTRNQMILWAASAFVPDSVTWRQVTIPADSVGPAIFPANTPIQSDSINGTIVTGYSTTQWPDTLGWLNCDVYPFNPTNTSVGVEVGDLNADPRTQGFRIYLVPAMLNGAFRPRWDMIALQAKQYGIPVGTDLTAVVLRIKDGHYFLGTQRAFITDGFVFRPVMEEVTEAELVSRLQAL